MVVTAPDVGAADDVVGSPEVETEEVEEVVKTGAGAVVGEDVNPSSREFFRDNEDDEPEHKI